MKYVVYIVTALCFGSSLQLPQENYGNSTTEETSTMTTIPEVTDATDKGINSFGLNLIKTMMKQNENQNVVVSPTGVAGLLAMTLLGSTGRTYDEIAQLIGFSQDILKNRECHEDFGTRLQHLSGNNSKTLYANAVFIDRRSKLRQIYRSYIERVYRGEALDADFGDTTEAKEVINEWVKNHTNNKIENFLQQPLPASTKSVLLSALYFSGQWAQPFVPEYTRKMQFKTPTKEIMFDLMANFGKFKFLFSYEDGLHMIQFPYNDSDTSMYVMKPRFPDRLNLSSLLDRLDSKKIDTLIDQMSETKCVVRFPKMELKSKTDLKDTLRALGAQTMFTPGQANFAIMLEGDQHLNDMEDRLINRISTGDGEPKTLKEMVDQLANPGVHVDSMIHEVKITIDEFGTEAVAATSAVMARSAELFYADSPFYMFIRNEKTKLVTFSAVINDPSE